MRYIRSIGRNVHGAYVIDGDIGSRQYYFYTKREAIRLYNQACKALNLVEKRG